MPIGGGSFTVQNKVLPGAYINFVSMGTNAKMGERGVAALPLELNWGPEGQVFKLDAADFNVTSLKVFGYDPTDANILLVREAMKRAKTLLIYRVNGGGTKASATVGGMTVTAKYGGTRGNAIKVAVITNVDDATKADVVTILTIWSWTARPSQSPAAPLPWSRTTSSPSAPPPPWRPPPRPP